MHVSNRSRAPRRREIYLAVLTGFVLCSGGAGAAGAESAGQVASQAVAYDIPAGPLHATLDAIAKQSGRRISYDRAVLAGQTAHAVRGSYTPKQAVEAAVAGHKIQVFEDAGGVLNAYVVGEIEKIEIRAKRDQAEKGFKADRSDTATRSGTDLMDLPGAVTIITAKVLETQQATNLRDTLRNVSGIGFSDSPQGLPTFSVRGFNQPAMTTNGISDRNAGQVGVFGVERIEVLKGPQAILAGNGSLGGGVNVVLKKPSAEPVRDVMVQYGTNADRTIAGDLSGAVSDDKRLSYRLVASSARAGTTDAGYDGRRDDSVMPQLRWKDAATDLIAGVSYHEQHLPLPLYTFARRDGLILPVPKVPLSNPKDGFDVREQRVFYQLEHKLGEAATVVSRLQYGEDVLRLHQRSGNLDYARGAPPDQPTGTVTLNPTSSRSAQRETSGDHYLRLLFTTGELAHKFVVGVNHNDFDLQQRQWSGQPKTVTLYPQAVPVELPPADANPDLLYISNVAQRQRALYVQDQLSWEDWILQLNWRRSRVTQSSDITYPSFNFTGVTPAVTVSRNTPGVGLIYRATPSVALYGNVANGFTAQTDLACGGGLVPPLSSRNKELGAKFSLLDDKLSLTTAAFQIDQSGRLVYDRPNNCYNVRAAQRTTGFEFDLQGELARGWQAMANYTYAKSKDVGDPTAPFPNKPRHKASLWTIYQLPQVQGLGVGLGLSAQSRTPGSSDKNAPFDLPGQAQVDASLFYEIPHWSFTLGVKNLADRQLYSGTTSGSYVPVVEGRSFMLSARHSFD